MSLVFERESDRDVCAVLWSVSLVFERERSQYYTPWRGAIRSAQWRRSSSGSNLSTIAIFVLLLASGASASAPAATSSQDPALALAAVGPPRFFVRLAAAGPAAAAAVTYPAGKKSKSSSGPPPTNPNRKMTKACLSRCKGLDRTLDRDRRDCRGRRGHRRRGPELFGRAVDSRAGALAHARNAPPGDEIGSE